MPSIFISYKRQSLDFALELKRRIEEDEATDFSAWIDQNIVGGEEWKKVIDTRLRECLAVVVVVTPAALLSPYVTYEWSFAIGLGKPVIPIILEQPTKKAPMHPRLDDHQNRDLSKGDENQWIKLLADLDAIAVKDHIPQEIADAVAKVKDSITFPQRHEAILNLQQMDHPQALAALIRFMDSQHPDTRSLASLAVAYRTDFEDLRAVRGICDLTERKDGNWRGQSLHVLANLGGDEAVNFLIKTAIGDKNSEDKAVWRALVTCFHKFQHPKALEFIKASILTTRGEIPVILVTGLRNMDDATLLPFLLEIACHPKVYQAARDEAVRAIGDLGDDSVSQRLFELLKGYPWVGIEAPGGFALVILNVLARLGHKRSELEGFARTHLGQVFHFMNSVQYP